MSDEQKSADTKDDKKQGEGDDTHSKKEAKVVSETPENAIGQMNPSSPGDTGTTPGTNAKVG